MYKEMRLIDGQWIEVKIYKTKSLPKRWTAATKGCVARQKKKGKKRR